MKAFVVDAFSNRIFGGNQAGIVFENERLSASVCLQIAGELKHSETAFVSFREDRSIDIRYFTPASEVDLCGHATIGTMSMLRQKNLIEDGVTIIHTKVGDLAVSVNGPLVWMDMSEPSYVRTLTDVECRNLYAAYGLTLDDCSENLSAEIITCGLSDIMMPVKNREALMRAEQNSEDVAKMSKEMNVVGVHMFCVGTGETTAYCSNFAPLYAIEEECATGTSNGVLTYYLYRKGIVKEGAVNSFVQGEHMHRPSVIQSKLSMDAEKPLIQIGGQAVISLECELNL